MRLKRIQQYLTGRGWAFQYCEQDGLGSVDFEYRGIGYHIWEFCQEPLEDEPEEMQADCTSLYGVESNLKNGGNRKRRRRKDHNRRDTGALICGGGEESVCGGR